VRLGAGFGNWSLDEATVEAGAAVSLPMLARAVSREGRGGLEWGVGIPGSVGGSVRQNAGCFGREVVDVLAEAEVLSLEDGKARWHAVDVLDMGYRHSRIGSTDVVVTARFRLHPADPAESGRQMREVTRWRKEHQPGGTLNAGSVFKNPPDVPAGAVIDSLGLKGFAVGPVRVSPRHANFIEADPGATAAAVRELIETVRERVRRATGRQLETEIQFVGFEEDD
jgi:UDP-N-acetylmuramate dehydrogenase